MRKAVLHASTAAGVGRQAHHPDIPTSALGRERPVDKDGSRPQAAVQLAYLKSRVVALAGRLKKNSTRVLSRVEDHSEVLREMKRLRTQAPGTTRMGSTQNAAKETKAMEYLLLARPQQSSQCNTPSEFHWMSRP